MQRLIIMRHGDAQRPAPGLVDFDRALTEEGRAESRLIGRALAAAGVTPDLALVSSARRAIETWRAVAEAFPSAAAHEERSLYAASAARLAAAVREAAGRAGTLMLVGHNPGLHQFAIHLAIQGGGAEKASRTLSERFPTGTAAVFTVGPDGLAKLEQLFLAKDCQDHRG